MHVQLGAGAAVSFSAWGFEYLGHGTRSQKICSNLHFVQVDLLEYDAALLLLGCQLLHLLDVNVLIGYDALVDLTEVAPS